MDCEENHKCCLNRKGCEKKCDVMICKNCYWGVLNKTYQQGTRYWQNYFTYKLKPIITPIFWIGTGAVLYRLYIIL